MMNITNFRNNVLTLTLNKAEKTRIENLGSRQYKFLVNKYTDFADVTELNFKNVWRKLNQILAEEDKFHRIQTHNMRNSKSRFVDYSNLAYNGCTDDF